MNSLRLLFAVLTGGVLLTTACTQQAAPAAGAASTNAPAVRPVESGKLIGKWLRPDGGYVLEIRAATPDGKLDAGYFNPNPIHVAQATWRTSESLGLVVFVELRDTGYPGATYRLHYRAADDKLSGAYEQPAAGQTFDVEFERQK